MSAPLTTMNPLFEIKQKHCNAGISKQKWNSTVRVFKSDNMYSKAGRQHSESTSTTVGWLGGCQWGCTGGGRGIRIDPYTGTVTSPGRQVSLLSFYIDQLSLSPRSLIQFPLSLCSVLFVLSLLLHSSKPFLLHYSFPPFLRSVNSVYRTYGPRSHFLMCALALGDLTTQLHYMNPTTTCSHWLLIIRYKLLFT